MELLNCIRTFKYLCNNSIIMVITNNKRLAIWAHRSTDNWAIKKDTWKTKLKHRPHRRSWGRISLSLLHRCSVLLNGASVFNINFTKLECQLRHSLQKGSHSTYLVAELLTNQNFGSYSARREDAARQSEGSLAAAMLSLSAEENVIVECNHNYARQSKVDTTKTCTKFTNESLKNHKQK